MSTEAFPLIGIFGGTFDPIHHGHLHVAHQLLQRLPLERIEFIPCHQPGHRDKPTASPAQRLAMVKLALASENKLIVNDCEIKRGGVSYTIDTLSFLKQHAPRQTLCLIVGSDAWRQFPQWKRSDDILQFAHVIVVNRGDDPVPLTSTSIQSLQQQDHGKIIFCTIPSCPISASVIREMPITASQAKLPASVYQYILQHSLYRSSSSEACI